MGKADVLTGLRIGSIENLILLKKFGSGSKEKFEDRTATGNPVIFTTNFAQNAKALSASFSPQQDLHGYSKPWAGGAGKNLIGSGNLVSGKSIDSNGAIVNYANRLATVDPIMIDNTKSYVFSTNSTDVRLMYAVFNGSTLIRRVIGVSSGTTLDVSDGDRLFISLYTYRLARDEEPLTWEVGGWYYNENTSQYVKWNTDTRIRSTFTPTKTGKAIIKKPTDQSFSVTVYSASRKFLITMSNTQYERNFDIIANDQIYFSAAPKSGDPMTTVEQASTLECYQTYDELDYRQINSESESVQLEIGSTPTAYEPYSNICPITGSDSVDIVANSNTIHINLGRTVYGGLLNVNTGLLGVMASEIASYNGETLPSFWVSDRDKYVAGSTPTTGAQVVYKLTTPLTYQVNPNQIALLEGENVIATDADSLNVTYKVKV